MVEHLSKISGLGSGGGCKTSMYTEAGELQEEKDADIARQHIQRGQKKQDFASSMINFGASLESGLSALVSISTSKEAQDNKDEQFDKFFDDRVARENQATMAKIQKLVGNSLSEACL